MLTNKPTRNFLESNKNIFSQQIFLFLANAKLRIKEVTGEPHWIEAKKKKKEIANEMFSNFLSIS